MIIDTSALIAILRDEPDAKACALETALVSTEAGIPSPAGVLTILSRKHG
jgi:uncharacterized protein with PIN domain